MKLPATAWFGVVFGVLWVLMDWAGPWFSGIFVPGIPAWWAVLLVLGALYAGGAATVARLPQRGLWRLSPLLVAVPLSVAVWAAREPMSHFAGPAAVVVSVLLGLRGLAEFAIATTVVGAFFVPGPAILDSYAVPALAALLATGTVIPAVQARFHAAARKATGTGQRRRALTMVRLSVPLALLERGTNRAVVVSFVGTVHGMTGAPARAVPWKRWAAAINRRRGRITDWADDLHDVAVNLHGAGRHEEALRAISRAEELTDRESEAYLRRLRAAGDGLLARRTEHELRFLALVEGRIRRDMGDVQGALRVAEEGLAVFEGENGLVARSSDDSQGLSFRVHCLYSDYLAFQAFVVGTLLHDDERALRLDERAVAVAADAGDQGRLHMFTYNRATYLVRLRRYGEAITVLKELLDADMRGVVRYGEGDAGGWVTPEARQRLMTFGGIANANRLQGDLDEAEKWYRQALTLAREVPGSFTVNVHLGLALVHFARGESAAARTSAAAGLTAAKRANTDAFLRAAHLVAGKVDETDRPASAYAHYRDVIELVERSRASLPGENERLQFLGGEPRVEAYERMVATCVALDRPGEAFDFAERGKARALAEQFGPAEGKPRTHEEARALLDERSLLVQYFTTAESVVVIGVRPDWTRPSVVEVPADRDALRRFVVTNFGEAGRVRQLVLSGLEELWHGYDPLVAPIADWSRPGDQVVLAPHGLLHYLPLHALRVGDGYLIERNPVSYTSSAALLGACRAKDRSADAPGAAVFGDPAGDLTHARAEAETVAELLATVPRLRREVTRAAVAAAVAEHGIVHYAGHAAFVPGDPMSSGLQLADGVLTARDIAATPAPGLRLATLSGCETGISRHHPGDDIQGLVRGFLYAGSPAVLASLWRVPDESAARIMTCFYKLLPETTTADALRRAVLEVRAQDDRWSSLHHWAPFVLVGDWV